MKRLMITALMGCTLMGQIKAGDLIIQNTAPGILLAGAAFAASAQLAHVSQLKAHHDTTREQQNKLAIFFKGDNNPSMETGTIHAFRQGKPIPNLAYRFAYWTRIASLFCIGTGIVASIYTKICPNGPMQEIAKRIGFGLTLTANDALIGIPLLAATIETELKPRTYKTI